MLLVATCRPNLSQRNITISSRYKPDFSRRCSHSASSMIGVINLALPIRVGGALDPQVGADIFDRLLTAFGSFSGCRNRRAAIRHRTNKLDLRW